MTAADRLLLVGSAPEFGLAAYCGLGRLEADCVSDSFADYLRALAIARSCDCAG